MGYYMSQGNTEFSIPKEHHEKALAAIQALHGKEYIKDSFGSRFCWVDSNFFELNDLTAILKAWRWKPKFKDGNIVGIEFTGEKLGSDKVLWEALAPFVTKGSFIIMKGEDGCKWKWTFDGVAFKEVGSETIFDDDEANDPEWLFNTWLEGMPEITIKSDAQEWDTVNKCYDGDVKKYLKDSFRMFAEQQQ